MQKLTTETIRQSKQLFYEKGEKQMETLWKCKQLHKVWKK